MDLVEERTGLEFAIRLVLDDAFARPDEGLLVDNLRRSGELAISLVAVDGEAVCGCVVLSRLRSPVGALALAPVAVGQAKQGQGIGSALIRRAVELAKERGFRMIFVLGEPAYYQRFGFSVETAREFTCAYAGPHFMGRSLAPGGCPRGAVIYAAAFDELT